MNDITSAEKSYKTVTPITVLVLGIVAAALSYSGYSVAGIIVGCIARKKVKTYLEENDGTTCTMVMVGSILSKVGIYLGIGITLYLVFFFSFYFAYLGAIISFLITSLNEIVSDMCLLFTALPF